MSQDTHPIDADWERLCERAQALWPDDAARQVQWLRAIAMLRTTTRGWLLDAHIPRLHTAVA